METQVRSRKESGMLRGTQGPDDTGPGGRGNEGPLMGREWRSHGDCGDWFLSGKTT